MKNIFKENYLSAIEIADLLEIDVKNLTYQYRNGHIPEPDFKVGNQRFWHRGTVYEYFENARLKAESKLKKLEMEVLDG